MSGRSLGNTIQIRKGRNRLIEMFKFELELLTAVLKVSEDSGQICHGRELYSFVTRIVGSRQETVDVGY